MPTYVSLFNWTQQGIEKVKDSPSRLDAARKGMKAVGAEVQAFYLVMGSYDMVLVWTAPDDETAARATLALASGGSIRSETLKAFTEDEYRKIIGSLP
jgi:uncharacterized protein with GYD domain